MNKKILFLVLLLFLGCSEQIEDNHGEATLVIKSIGNTTTQKYNVNGVTAYELLDFGHEVELTYGDYLRCIDDVCANKEYVWTFYVNEAESSLGAKQYTVKRGDRIGFRFDKGG